MQVRPALQDAIPKGDTSVVDKALGNQFVQQSLAIVANIAHRCTEMEGTRRPSMSEVVKELKRALDAEDLLPSVIEPSLPKRALDVEDQLPRIIEPSLPKQTLQPTPKNTIKQFKPFHSQEFYPAQRSQHITFRAR